MVILPADGFANNSLSSAVTICTKNVDLENFLATFILYYFQY
jgi:hypothetical protein